LQADQTRKVKTTSVLVEGRKMTVLGMGKRRNVGKW